MTVAESFAPMCMGAYGIETARVKIPNNNCSVRRSFGVHLPPEDWSRDKKVTPVATYQHKIRPTQASRLKLAIFVFRIPKGM